MPRPHSLIAASLALALSACGELDQLHPGDPLGDIEATSPPGEGIVLAERIRTVGDRQVRMLKVEVDGEVIAHHEDLDGNPLSLDALAVAPPPVIEAALAARLAQDSTEPTLRVLVGLTAPPAFDADDPAESGGHETDADGFSRVTYGETPLTLLDVLTLREERAARIDELRAMRSAWRAEAWRALAERHGIDQPSLSTAIAEGARSIELDLTPDQIRDLAEQSADRVAAIELPGERRNALASAMRDTSVDPVVFGALDRQGAGVGIYFSEQYCPAPGVIGNYRRLSGNQSQTHDQRVSRIMRTVSPRSYIYCRYDFRLPNDADLAGVAGNPRILVENHSWGNTYDGTPHGDTTYRLADRDFDDHVYEDSIAVFVAAGNDGAIAAHGVASPAKSLNALAVGNYDDTTNQMRDSSSFRDSEIGNRKPELSAPGTAIVVAGMAGNGTGTSFASPHAAAFAADLMGAMAWLQLRPEYVGAMMLAGATDAIGGGVDRVGLGGIDMTSTFFDGTNQWWDGRNGDFALFDRQDVQPGNGRIEARFNFNTAQHRRARVVLRWATRGSYTLAQRTAANPIGRDLDIEVLDPNGAVVGISSSFDDPFESVDFAPARSGTYTVRIREFANRDMSLRLRMGLSVNFY